MNVLLCGGGTGGSVTALLAIADELRVRRPETTFHFLGSSAEPERLLVAREPMTFASIAAGKLRRYPDWRNAADLGRLVLGFWQALRLLRSIRPNIIVATGSYIAVPVVWAGWLLGIPAVTHQLDLEFGLANRLMLPFVRRCTVGFQETSEVVKSRKLVRTGNPYRRSILEGDSARARRQFDLNATLPVVLFLGGGTGALRLNQAVLSAAPKLAEKCQILHLTGRGKFGSHFLHPNYHPFDFLVDEMKDAYAVADLVVCRAGLGTLTELSVLGKPAILVPIAGSHQERNARYFQEAEAAIVLNEALMTDASLSEIILDLLHSGEERARLGQRMRGLARMDANEKIVDAIFDSP